VIVHDCKKKTNRKANNGESEGKEKEHTKERLTYPGNHESTVDDEPSRCGTMDKERRVNVSWRMPWRLTNVLWWKEITEWNHKRTTETKTTVTCGPSRDITKTCSLYANVIMQLTLWMDEYLTRFSNYCWSGFPW
jgi:hypothetical protein